jgi:Tol biopolymer transport system component
MRRVATSLALTLLVAALAGAPAARADFTPSTLISGNANVEADRAADPAISADGRYVAFQGSVAGILGLYRKDLQTGALDIVAAGDAASPSISADGNFVSFTTTALHPDTGLGRQCSSVYVRDMSQTGPAAFTLVSALDGTTVGLTYAGSSHNGCRGGGSAASDRTAITADGSEVAFTVVGESNLTTGARGAPTTPGAQVAVRNLRTGTTTLVSQTLASIGGTPTAVPHGAAMTDTSTAGGTANSDPGDSTASISADGSTVAWLAINIPSQAPAAAVDAPKGYADEYDEPLWRRIADGPAAPIRRVLGGDDPVGPCPGGCTGPLDLQWDGEQSQAGSNTGPERGSLIAYQGFQGATAGSVSTLDDGTPQLSADGQTVAVLSTAPPIGEDPPCTQGQCAVSNVDTNAFIVNMTPGLNRSQALTRITEWASPNLADNNAAGPITSLAISPQGDQIAFVTERTEFPYSPPSLLTPPISTVDATQLYVANLTDQAMELASLGFDGQPANGVVESPAFSNDGGPIAFASSATNLVYGAESEAQGGAEVFTTTEVKPPAPPGIQTIGAPPPAPVVAPLWALSATAHTASDGSLLVTVDIPGPGLLRASATAAMPTVSGPERGATGGRRRRKRHPRARASVARRSLARTAADAQAEGAVQLTLRPASRYRALIARARGMYATVTVTFAAAGHPTLRQTLPAEFAAPPGHRHARRKGLRR